MGRLAIFGATADSEVTRLLLQVRDHTEMLVTGLSDADATVQSMEDASPAKWHLAHTSWFFENLILIPHARHYFAFDEAFNFIFNSYYESLGKRHPRAKRGLLTRPSLEVILDYRAHVTKAMVALLESDPAVEVLGLVALGIHHEQQHQELLLTDILHLFAQSPLKPIYHQPGSAAAREPGSSPLDWVSCGGGLIPIGHFGDGFAFDCEGPRHDVLVEPFRIADRLITSGEWIEFINDGGYRNPLLWLSDGWARVQTEGWIAPLYWEERGGVWWSMTLQGPKPVDLAAPVRHVSFFEADAYASWAGKRLPTEFEWEHAAADVSLEGNFALAGRNQAPPPAATAPVGDRGARELKQMFGEAWQWTRSPFIAYPRYRPQSGAVGEYNGKFMSGQFVLRGSSCVTPDGHTRRSYRNFFQPDKRWQFSGVRLAEDV